MQIVKIVAKLGQGWVSENATKALPQAPCLEKTEQAAPLAACKERDHDPRRAVRMRMQTQRQPTDPDAHNPDGAFTNPNFGCVLLVYVCACPCPGTG